MKECVKCSRNENQVKLLDAVYGSEIVSICEECVATENIPIIRRPSSFQLTESEKSYSVRQRLSRMAGIKIEKESKTESAKPVLNLSNIRPAKNYSGIIESRCMAAKSNEPLNLIDNWNWHIQMARRNRKLSISQVGEVIGEQDSILKMIEQGNLPSDGIRIIRKLEQYLKINLRKSEINGENERIEKAKERAVVLPARILNFDAKAMGNLTLSDLKRMKNEREEFEKKEKEFAEKKPEVNEEKKEELKKSLQDERKGILDRIWDGFGKRKKAETAVKNNGIEEEMNEFEGINGKL